MKRFAPLVVLLLILGVIVLPEWLTDYSYPKSYQIDQFPLVDQPDEITCGPTSALMVLKFYGKDVTLKQVESETKTEWMEFEGRHIGMTAPEFIPRAMEHFGVKSFRRSGDLNKIKHHVSQGKPVIVLVRSGRMTWHYVVVVGYDEKIISIADPGGGVRWNMPTDSFLGSWQFSSDMQGISIVPKCKACKGTGRWLPASMGPLGVCEFCGGTGKETDFAGATLRYSDIYPMTMIVPK